jgi:tripartite-type tricarboxylate transporter receptor subunit TctC
MRRFALAFVGALGALLVPSHGQAQTPAEFYKDKTIRFIVGSNTGGSYDSYSRLLATFMGKHIPGNPRLVVENMPGASGVQSANYLAVIAPKDGSAMGMFNQSMGQRQMLEPQSIQFDMARFGWIGAMGSSVTVFISWYTSGVKTLEDAKAKQITMGALSADGGNAVYPLLLNEFLGTKFKVVLGYPGGNTIQLAMERGEVDGRGSVVWSGFKAGWPHWIAEKKVNILLQVGLAKDPDLPDVPLLIDLAKTPEQAAIFRFISSDNAMGFPVLTPPGVPADRVAAMRKALSDTFRDADFMKTAAERKLPVRFTSGEEVERIVGGIIGTPREVIARLRKDLAAANATAAADKGK